MKRNSKLSAKTVNRSGRKYAEDAPEAALPRHAPVADADVQDDDLDEAEDTATEEQEQPEEHADGPGADDALGLYLRQMGAIPLLAEAIRPDIPPNAVIVAPGGIGIHILKVFPPGAFSISVVQVILRSSAVVSSSGLVAALSPDAPRTTDPMPSIAFFRNSRLPMPG